MSGEENLEPQFTELPLPPTAGQILGFVIKHLGGLKPPFDGKQHQRFFGGRDAYKVPLETKNDIISDVAEWIVEIGLLPRDRSSPDDRIFQAVLFSLHAHISDWEWWRHHVFDNRVFVPEDVIKATWVAYVRAATIELALRIAAGMIMARLPSNRAGLIRYVAEARPGDFLKDLQKDADITRDQLAAEMDRAPTTIDNWLDQDSRPRDDALHELAAVMAGHLGISQASIIEGDLRRLYLLDDIAELLSEFVGSEVVSECLERLHRYVGRSYDYLVGAVHSDPDTNIIGPILLSGTIAPAAQHALDALARAETDEAWVKDLRSASLPWQMRVMLDTVQAMTTDYEEHRWLLGSHARGSFESHFDEYGDDVRQAMHESMLLLHEGRLVESADALARLTELDPLNTKLQEFVGISKKDLGLRIRSNELLEEALDSLWLAATADEPSLRTLVAIGHNLCLLGRAGEAIEHLKSVDPEQGHPDTEYYKVLSIAYKFDGQFAESLNSLESAMKLDPADPELRHLATRVAALAGDKATTRRYAREARRLGMPDAELEMLVGLAEWVSVNGRPNR